MHGKLEFSTSGLKKLLRFEENKIAKLHVGSEARSNIVTAVALPSTVRLTVISLHLKSNTTHALNNVYGDARRRWPTNFKILVFNLLENCMQINPLVPPIKWKLGSYGLFLAKIVLHRPYSMVVTWLRSGRCGLIDNVLQLWSSERHMNVTMERYHAYC